MLVALVVATSATFASQPARAARPAVAVADAIAPHHAQVTTAKRTAVVVKKSYPLRVAAPKQTVKAVDVVHPATLAAVVRPSAAPAAPRVASASTTYGCGPALAWLSTHSAPGFRFECPGYSLGHQAMTCVDVAGVCPGIRLITISVPCAAAYMNEASNSWVLTGQSNAPIDPYGHC